MPTTPVDLYNNVYGDFASEADLSVGCYCADESRRHRSTLPMLLDEHGANVA